MNKKKVLLWTLLSVVFVGIIIISTIFAYSDRAPGEPFSFAQKTQINIAYRNALEKAGRENAQSYTLYWEDESPALNKGNYIGPFKYFGVFDGAMVIYNTGGSAALVITSVSLGKCRFIFPDITLPVVIFDGNVYGFKYAYEAGILSYDDVREIYTHCRTVFSYLY